VCVCVCVISAISLPLALLSYSDFVTSRLCNNNFADA